MKQKQVLKSRIITASILIPFVVLGILYLPIIPFAIVSGLLFLLAGYEWTNLAGFKSKITRLLALLAIPLFGLFILGLLYVAGKNVLEQGFPIVIVAFWLTAVFFLYRFPKDNAFWKFPVVGIITGSLVLTPAWFMMMLLKYMDPKLILYVMILVWVADSAAYFAGRRFGKTKLAPEISPGKTWEGVIAALIASLIVIVLGFYIIEPKMKSFHWIFVGLLTAIFSIIGDLFESAFKRLRGVKDSGTILPGHGGILDRIDSLTAAIPIFGVGMAYF